LVGVAVNVTEPPLHIEVVLDVMVTDGVTDVVVIVIGLLVAVVGLAQGSLLVIITETIFPLPRVDVIKVEAVCPPTFTPLIIH
jgi:predicted RecA/RadA family phage recombinase